MSTVSFPNDRKWSLTGTVLFHAAILSCLFLMKCGGGGGGGNGGFGYTGLMSMDVAAIGNDVDGWGDQPDEEAPVESAIQDPVVEETNAITEETASPETPVVNNKPNEKPTTKPKDPVTKPVKEEKPKQVSGGLNNALGNINKGGNGTTSGGGQQGSSDGKIDGKGVLNGGGSTGDGGGQGGGSGTGTGTGTGPGSGSGSGGMNSTYKLAGRSMLSKPSLSEKAPEEGVVVVDIWVDKNGIVTKAVANPALSTATSAQLFKLAEKAAKKAKFSTSNQNEQKGTITITFKLS